MRLLSASFFDHQVDRVARDLIGAVLMFDGVGGIIVEVESYDEHDPASHCYGRRVSERNRAMFGPPAHAYVYRSYGIHWCLNLVCRPASAVLIRALEPKFGIAKMQERRGVEALKSLCAGPGRLCEALAITGAANGHSLLAPPFALYARTRSVNVTTGVRIGITKAIDLPRRFGLAASPFLSRRFPEE